LSKPTTLTQKGHTKLVS